MEVAQGSMVFLAIFLTLLSAWLWMLGGRSISELGKLAVLGSSSNRIYYRVVAPVFFSLSVISLSLLSHTFRLTNILLIPAYLLVTHLGHTKFHERLIECLLYGFVGITVCFHTQSCMILYIQLVLCVLAALIGHFYQDKKAPIVELLVNFLRILLIGVMVL